MAVVGTKNILGEQYDIEVSQYGVFYIQERDEDDKRVILGSGETLDEATAKARTELNKHKVKVDVKFITKKGQKGTATGFHGRDKRILVQMSNGDRTPMNSSARVFKPAMPDEKLDEFISKTEKIQQLESEIRQILSEWEFPLATRVKYAIEEALKNKPKPLARTRREK